MLRFFFKVFSYISFKKDENKGRVGSVDPKAERRTAQHKIKLDESLIFLVIHHW
jgi:hypothetical protein